MVAWDPISAGTVETDVIISDVVVTGRVDGCGVEVSGVVVGEVETGGVVAGWSDIDGVVSVRFCCLSLPKKSSPSTVS